MIWLKRTWGARIQGVDACSAFPRTSDIDFEPISFSDNNETLPNGARTDIPVFGKLLCIDLVSGQHVTLQAQKICEVDLPPKESCYAGGRPARKLRPSQ